MNNIFTRIINLSKKYERSATVSFQWRNSHMIHILLQLQCLEQWGRWWKVSAYWKFLLFLFRERGSAMEASSYRAAMDPIPMQLPLFLQSRSLRSHVRGLRFIWNPPPPEKAQDSGGRSDLPLASAFIFLLSCGPMDFGPSRVQLLFPKPNCPPAFPPLPYLVFPSL